MPPISISRGSVFGTRRILAPKDLSSIAISSVIVKAMLRKAVIRAAAVATERRIRELLLFCFHKDFTSRRPSMSLPPSHPRVGKPGLALGKSLSRNDNRVFFHNRLQGHGVAPPVGPDRVKSDRRIAIAADYSFTVGKISF